MTSNETNNRISIYLTTGETLVYEGNYYIYREDYIKEGCIHFKDSDGKHHRIYNAVVSIDEL